MGRLSCWSREAVEEALDKCRVGLVAEVDHRDFRPPSEGQRFLIDPVRNLVGIELGSNLFQLRNRKHDVGSGTAVGRDAEGLVRCRINHKVLPASFEPTLILERSTVTSRAEYSLHSCRTLYRPPES